MEAIKEVARNSLMSKHPRFYNLLVCDKRGRERWRRTKVEIDCHVIVVDRMIRSSDEEDLVNDYIADLSVSSPLGQDKPMWEIHLLKAKRCVVFRIHHALGDGISLMSPTVGRFRIPTGPWLSRRRGKSGGKRWRRSAMEVGGGGGGVRRWRRQRSAVETAKVGGGGGGDRRWRRRRSVVGDVFLFGVCDEDFVGGGERWKMVEEEEKKD
ncbi:Wax ester synthase/diacylglycerol acyltransferase 2 [Linum perenne]